MPHPIKVLVIDDEQSILELMQLVFSDPNEVTLEVLSKPLQWKEVFKRYQPDVLLVDYRMPELSGADLLTLINQSEFKESVHGIGLFSATPLPAWEVQQMGAHLFIAKPFDVLELFKNVRNLASMPKRRDAA